MTNATLRRVLGKKADVIADCQIEMLAELELERMRCIPRRRMWAQWRLRGKRPADGHIRGGSASSAAKRSKPSFVSGVEAVDLTPL